MTDIERGSGEPEWAQHRHDAAWREITDQAKALAENAALRVEVERLQAELREHCDLAKSSNAEHADIEAAWRAEVERLQREIFQDQDERGRLSAEVERLDERFDAVRDAAHAEAKRVFPATVIESHIGGELHADDLCSMLVAEVERLREERRWRDAKSEPPEEFVYVTVFIPRLGVSVACYKAARTQAWEDDNGYECHPTHWQPLPAPPEKEE